MKRLAACGVLVALLGLVLSSWAADMADKQEAKEKLKELQDYIGGWKGSGGPDKPRPGPRDPIWNEILDWSWRFKGDDAWLALQIKNGKFFKSGQMRYLPERKLYQLTLTDKGDKKVVLEGSLKN